MVHLVSTSATQEVSMNWPDIVQIFQALKETHVSVSIYIYDVYSHSTEKKVKYF